MKSLKIAIAYHKPSELIANDVYIPVQVGKSLHPALDLGIQTDNQGENISTENNVYCELTALYWLWKNVTADYKGLCHYRRLFTNKTTVRHFFATRALKRVYCLLRNRDYTHFPHIVYKNPERFVHDAEIASEQLKKQMLENPIVTTHKVHTSCSCYRYFAIVGFEYLTLLERIIKEKYPAYSSSVDNVYRSFGFHFANMVIMRNDYFEEYCSFMFGVLEAAKASLLSEGWLIDLNREKMFARKLGYMAEVVTNIYIAKKRTEHIRIKEMNVAYLDA